MTRSFRGLSALLLAVCVAGPLPAFAQIVPSGTIDAISENATLLTGGATLPTGGWATVAVQLDGTFTGTVSSSLPETTPEDVILGDLTPAAQEALAKDWQHLFTSERIVLLRAPAN